MPLLSITLYLPAAARRGAEAGEQVATGFLTWEMDMRTSQIPGISKVGRLRVFGAAAGAGDLGLLTPED